VTKYLRGTGLCELICRDADPVRAQQKHEPSVGIVYYFSIVSTIALITIVICEMVSNIGWQSILSTLSKRDSELVEETADLDPGVDTLYSLYYSIANDPVMPQLWIEYATV
jgi:hypothetical protein